jgi:hypothetical protein
VRFSSVSSAAGIDGGSGAEFDHIRGMGAAAAAASHARTMSLPGGMSGFRLVSALQNTREERISGDGSRESAASTLVVAPQAGYVSFDETRREESSDGCCTRQHMRMKSVDGRGKLAVTKTLQRPGDDAPLCLAAEQIRVGDWNSNGGSSGAGGVCTDTQDCCRTADEQFEAKVSAAESAGRVSALQALSRKLHVAAPPADASLRGSDRPPAARSVRTKPPAVAKPKAACPQQAAPWRGSERGAHKPRGNAAGAGAHSLKARAVPASAAAPPKSVLQWSSAADDLLKQLAALKDDTPEAAAPSAVERGSAVRADAA